MSEKLKILSDYEQQAVILSAYDPQWPELFETEKAALADIFEGFHVHVEHIGSTAVPGLCAKPVIDIMLGAAELREVDERLDELKKQGWFYVPEYENEMPFRRFFLKCDGNGARSHHLHAVEFGGDFWRRHLIFRDYLRRHPQEAQAYGDLKQSLLAENIDRHKIYSQAKSAFIGALEAKAQLWWNAPASKGLE